jgi:hypothetical protein
LYATYPANLLRFDLITLRYLVQSTNYEMRFVAFPATEYDEVFSGYQPGQIVQQ